MFKKNPPCLSLGALLDTANARVHRAAERRAWTRRFGGKLAPWRQASGWRSAGGARLRSLPAMNRQLPLLQLEMSRSKSRPHRMMGLLLCLATAAILAACHTNPPLAPVSLSGPGWTLHQGQAVWRSKSGAPEIAGELMLATHHDGRTVMQFTKTPLPFVFVQTTPNRWRMEFVPENKTYSGRGQPPPELAWLQLSRCLAGTVPPTQWNWWMLEGDKWRLENKSTGEFIDGYLTR